MESLRVLADRLDVAGATLTSLGHAVTATDPAHPAFGADAAGRPGELGRALHRQWAAATGSRAKEATAAAARLAAAAAAVRGAADHYAAADDSARRTVDRYAGVDRQAGVDDPARRRLTGEV